MFTTMWRLRSDPMSVCTSLLCYCANISVDSGQLACHGTMPLLGEREYGLIQNNVLEIIKSYTVNYTF